MKDFTSQQKEIVARKLGYDGPMQGFDEFIASSPALEARYAAISGKFSERMAKGGLVKMKPKGYAYGGPVYTDEQFFQQTGSWTKAAELRDKQNQAIAAATTAAGGVSDKVVADWWSQPANQKKSDSEIKDLMDQFKVTPDQFSRAIGANTATTTDIKQRYFDEAERDRVAAANAATAAATALANAQTEAQRQAALAAAAEAERLRLAALAASSSGSVSGGGNVTFAPVGGTPQAAAASQIKPEKIIADAKQNIDTAATQCLHCQRKF
jgi:hypothetical protein